MSIDIKAPTFPESVADGTVAVWHKQAGEAVSRDEPLVDIETDKVTLEVVAPANGVVGEILKQEGDTVQSDEIIGKLEEGEAPAKGGGEKAEKAEAGKEADKGKGAEKKESEPRRDNGGEKSKSSAEDGSEVKLSPAARKLVDEKDLDAGAIEPTGKGGLVTKEDVLNHLKQPSAEKERPAPAARQVEEPLAAAGEREEKRVPMTRLRKRIAERLLEATQTTAMLTTFNEVNMKPIMDLRQQYKELFEKTHNGVRLGFMGFFVKAACEALQRFPGVNASIDGDDIVYHGYQDIGVAVSTDKGLVVPVLRDADQMGLAQIEDKVRDYGQRARDGKLGIEEIQGGTFTITNGGVFGSLLSTPILNPPQTAILGMHKIQERPMAIDGEVVVLPMMYLALSYDHRLVDGKEAVQFLVTIKELVEEPARILLEV